MMGLRQQLHGVSLRVRITLWYAGMLLITLVIFSLGIHFGIDQYLKHSVQRELASDAQSIVNDFLSRINEKGESWALGEIREAYPPSDNDPFVRISSGDRVFIEPQLPGGLQSPLASLPSASAVPPEGSFHRYKVDRDWVMIYSLPYRAPNGQVFKVETGTSLALSYAAIHTLDRLLLLAMPLLLLAGAGGGYLLMKRPLKPLRDLTEKAEVIGRKELGERLPVSPTADELERLTHSLNRMIDRLEEALAHNHRFSADASHELRTPLTIMRGELEELLGLPDLPSQAVENLVSTLDEIERMSCIVSSLMTITRLDVGGERMAIQPVSLTVLARTTSEQMRLLAVERGFELKFAATTDIWVNADPMRLKQVLVNLIDNAIKYTPQVDLLTIDGEELESTAVHFDSYRGAAVDKGAGITVQVTAQQDKAVLEIRDHGVGISLDSLPHIFGRFYRADFARTRVSGGVGLGLAIVKSIVTAHDGTVSASSELGLGTTMRVELPLLASKALLSETLKEPGIATTRS
jgi:signal transduction histidine kinase